MLISDLHRLCFQQAAAVKAAGTSHHCLPSRVMLDPSSPVGSAPGDGVQDCRVFHHAPILMAGTLPANATPAEWATSVPTAAPGYAPRPLRAAKRATLAELDGRHVDVSGISASACSPVTR